MYCTERKHINTRGKEDRNNNALTVRDLREGVAQAFGLKQDYINIQIRRENVSFHTVTILLRSYNNSESIVCYRGHEIKYFQLRGFLKNTKINATTVEKYLNDNPILMEATEGKNIDLSKKILEQTKNNIERLIVFGHVSKIKSMLDEINITLDKDNNIFDRSNKTLISEQ